MPKSALGGVKALELCQMVAGPYCTKLMGDLGAKVVKIEPPRCGDIARRSPPFFHDTPDVEGSGLFLYLNTSKLGVTLDVTKSTGKSIFIDLVKDADILVEDNPPGWMAEHGLGYDDLKAINPGLIMTSITPFGQTGPYRDYKAHSLNVFQGSGEGYLTPGGPENMGRPPLRLGTFVGEYDSGMNAANATLGALFHKKRTGTGQWIDISKQEAIMSLNRLDMARFANEGEVITRARLGAPYGGVLPCKDGYTVFITWEAEQWDKLVHFMGDPEWARDEMFQDYADRYRYGEVLNALLTEWLMNYTKEELYHRGQEAGIAFGMVFTSKDLVESEHLKAREFFVDVDHPRTGTLKYPGAPYKFSETPWCIVRPAPTLGEHNEDIFVKRLGRSKQEIVKLYEAGVI
ncbi:MAG: CoA transferase [Chloroflexota bacterium]|nr:CoA transferase [Chloroflexota bacterium]